ncbi:MAG TPA: ABC transporter substrate-binding protein, partial [Thiolapillus brandeum]|nr:ABC transporter substrate-binding protein [Thiolapillus brandeum]
ELDFAWICGDPYVRGLKEGILRYVSTPMINNKPSYRIYLIVPAMSSAKTLEDLKGGIFAFSDPDSVSFQALVGGYLRSKREAIGELDSFFKVHFFTYNHVNTVMAVADKMADGGSVDGHVWEELTKQFPELTKKTKVIARSEHYGLPPIVASWRVKNHLVERMKSVLIDMNDNQNGLEILGHLQSSRFSDMDDTLYDSIRNGPAQFPLESGRFHPGTPRTP